MNPSRYDLLVIGGGPAGSTAAAVARRHGLKVLVVEKSTFPRFRIGESLLPAGNRILRELGVWDRVERAGFMPKFGAEFHRADGSACKRVVFNQGLLPDLDRTYQVDRAKFDSLLLDHARERGADVAMATAVRGVDSHPDGHRVTLADANGERTIDVPWIIDTSGRDAGVTTPLKRALDPLEFPKRIAVYGHFHGVARETGPAAGNIVIVRTANGWFWLIPLDEQRTSVGVVSTVKHYQANALAPAAFFEQELQRSAKLRELMAHASPVTNIHVASDYSYFRRDLATDRLVLAGDAAGFLDPIFSTGVLMATWMGQQAGELISRAHSEHRVLHAREQRRYTRTVKRRAGVFHRLIMAFYDDDAFDVFMCQQVPWGLAPGLTSIVAGESKLTWPLWWRFHLFLLVCRLQKRWKLVKPSPTAVQPVRTPHAA